MSIANSSAMFSSNVHSQFNATTAKNIAETIQSVQDLISPVWPLRDYVAVNPYGGLSDETFLGARQRLQQVSDCETLMPLDYYRERFQQGKFALAEIELAVDEMVADQIPEAETLNANAIYRILSSPESINPGGEGHAAPARIRVVSDYYDRFAGTEWSEAFLGEISKHCAAHYDKGQASWPSPWKDMPLYQAWREAAQLDRNIELLGLVGFRRFVGNLPHTPEATVFLMLSELSVPAELWQEYLLCIALTMPGWSAWAKFQTKESAKQGFENSDFAAVLAMRLAYEVAFSRRFNFSVDFGSVAQVLATASRTAPRQDALLAMTLLRANEIGFRNRLLDRIQSNAVHHSKEQNNGSLTKQEQRKLAQMVFCIDVRSERIRRNLESASTAIETFGFAGFFGLPFEYVRLGDQTGTSQLPVLVDPKFKVFEEVRHASSNESKDAVKCRARIRGLRHLWKSFQTSAVSCFAFVETTGLFFAYKLVTKVFANPAKDTKFDGVQKVDRDRLGPGFRNLHRQGISNTHQVDMAESILRGLGLTKDFARLVVLCGHAATTENNPLQAGLDCGACAGHSGEANARFGAMLLNKHYIRSKLAERGIEIPQDVHFLAGIHNTTTDEISFFDADLLPSTHEAFLAELKQSVAMAGLLTRQERLASLPGDDTHSLIRRSVDWSEVRPEWGLAGNAAFIVGPRSLTKSSYLKGEAFLHSYDYRNDPTGQMLEQIMTAPMVVANMINMQYYASTVDQRHFGSGSKTIHNVVGKFGLLSGNGGDLTTGLPWQSIHNGESYAHDPVRLLALIEAPKESIERILEKHQNVRELVVNGWINLVAIDGDEFYRHTENSDWQQLDVGVSALGKHPIQLQANQTN